MKIFWSWQSDHPGSVSRHFVRRALELAAASLTEELAVEEPEREVQVDYDRKGVPGSPDLAALILEKIRNSDVVVADVTPVGVTQNDPPKKLMNPNVAIELGYALHSITDRRTIMVMNTAFGSRADLPFDLQHKAGPITYELPAGAAKAAVESARAGLVAELKVALRGMLPRLSTPTEGFVEIRSCEENPSRFFREDEVLVKGRGPSSRGVGYSVAGTPCLYLRVVPKTQTKELKRAMALDSIRSAPNCLVPFASHSGAAFEANAHGAISYDLAQDANEIVAGTQLFLNREIWGFNTILLSPTRAERYGFKPGIPTRSVEEVFAKCLRAYIRFMNEKLDVSPPYRIEGGAFDVKDYIIWMPDSYFDREWGPIYVSHVQWSGVLNSLESESIDAVLLSIFDAFFDAGGCSRPEGLYGFPQAPLGTHSTS